MQDRFWDKLLVAFKIFSNKKQNVWGVDLFGGWDNPLIPSNWITLTLSLTKTYANSLE